jgi:uncharacterized RDD family membrane protein YckC
MASATLNTLPIRTPEGVTFSLTLAGPTSRFLAYLVDLCCITALAQVASKISEASGAIGADFGSVVRVLLFFAITVGYGIVCEWYWRGQTVGKRMLRLRVVDRQGLRLQPSQIITRNLLRFADALPAFYVLGGLTVLVNRHGQRLGDIAANTVVARTEELRQPDLDQMSRGRFNSLAQYPHLAARLRQRVSPKTANVALQALLRRDQFDPAARVELFGEMAKYFRELVEFPAEAIEQLADEPYVRNVVEILFQTR